MTINEWFDLFCTCFIPINALFLIVIIICSICYTIRQILKSEKHKVPSWELMIEFMEAGIQFMFFTNLFLLFMFFIILIILIF